VIRGVHFTDVPPGQAKYVTCLAGEVLDIVVDVRAGSPAFGTWDAVRLGATHRNAVYMSEGLGHAFMALTDEATVVYLCSSAYAGERERAVHPLDPELGLPWPADIPHTLSERDRSAAPLRTALDQGWLPRYEQCLPAPAGLS
jgi:dTDP-4-dehydrorhamnose 3,5-epimerase